MFHPIISGYIYTDRLTEIPQVSNEVEEQSANAYKMRESRVPSSRFGRLWQYGGLATSMAFGAVGEGFRRATGSAVGAGGSLMLSAGNMERLVGKLSRMRGAALKLGQMMSFQGVFIFFEVDFWQAGANTLKQTLKCFLRRYMRSYRESKTARITCQLHNAIKFLLVILVIHGGSFSRLLMRCRWRLLPLVKSTVQF